MAGGTGLTRAGEAAGLAYSVHDGGRPAHGRPPLVLIHGAAGDRHFWPPALRRLGDVLTYALDLPGHGASAGPASAAIDALAARVAAWAAALGLAPAIWVGHSMGGATALALALDRPGQTAGLALIGSAGHLPVNPLLLEGAADRARLAETLDRVVRWSFARTTPPRLTALARRRLGAADPGVLHADLSACAAFDVRARLPEIAVPALVLCGGEDRMTPPALVRQAAEAIPGAAYAEVEGAGHMVMLERPQAVAEALRAFLGAWAPAGAARGGSA